SSGTYDATITSPASPLRVCIELQDVAIVKLRNARSVIAQHTRHHIRQLWGDYLLAGVNLVLVEHLTGATRDNLVDGIVRNVHSPVSKNALCRGVIDEAN